MSIRTRWLGGLLAALLVVAVAQPAVAAESVNDLAPEVAVPGDDDLLDRFDAVIKCVTLDDEVFCTELGFLEERPDSKAWRDMVGNAVAADVSGSGDMSYADLVARLEAMPPKELAARQSAQIDNAKRAVGRMKLVDHLAEKRIIPEGFFDRYPSLGAPEGSAMAKGLRAAAADVSSKSLLEHLRDAGVPVDSWALDPYGEEPVGVLPLAGGKAAGLDVPAVYDPPGPVPPAYRYIIFNYYVEQTESYYCGPATMDSIDWADDGWQNGQEFWAGPNYLNTDAQGATALADLVDGTNDWTGWDSSSHGGSYAMVSVDGKTQSWFVTQHKLRIGAYGAPVIEHVRLRTAYFPYLRYNASGHFQTGRGYSDNTGKIAIFEPYDERDWRSGGYATGRRQYVLYANMWDATRTHPHENFGV